MDATEELCSEDEAQMVRYNRRQAGEAVKDLRKMFTRLENEVREVDWNQDKPNPESREWVQRASDMREVIFPPLR